MPAHSIVYCERCDSEIDYSDATLPNGRCRCDIETPMVVLQVRTPFDTFTDPTSPFEDKS